MQVSLDLSDRVWVVEHLGQMQCSKHKFLWCEAHVRTIMPRPEEIAFRRGKELYPADGVQPLNIDLPDFILKGLADTLFDSQQLQHRTMDALTEKMIEKLHLQVVH